MKRVISAILFRLLTYLFSLPPEPFQILAGDQLMGMNPGWRCFRLPVLFYFFHITSFHSLKIIMEKPKRMGLYRNKITQEQGQKPDLSPSDFEKIGFYFALARSFSLNAFMFLLIFFRVTLA